MILTEEAARKRLTAPNNLANRFGSPILPPTTEESLNGEEELPAPTPPSSVVEIRKQVRPGNPGYRLPNDVKTTIAILARSGTPQKELAQDFNTTQGEVSHIERGKSKGVDETMVDRKLASVRDSALERLTQAVLGITDDKIANTKAIQLSSVARNLAGVIQDLSPKKDITGPVAPQIIIYSPSIREESSYQTVEVSGVA